MGFVCECVYIKDMFIHNCFSIIYQKSKKKDVRGSYAHICKGCNAWVSVPDDGRGRGVQSPPSGCAPSSGWAAPPRGQPEEAMLSSLS